LAAEANRSAIAYLKLEASMLSVEPAAGAEVSAGVDSTFAESEGRGIAVESEGGALSVAGFSEFFEFLGDGEAIESCGSVSVALRTGDGARADVVSFVESRFGGTKESFGFSEATGRVTTGASADVGVESILITGGIGFADAGGAKVSATFALGGSTFATESTGEAFGAEGATTFAGLATGGSM
jgi:hypothetical protein